MTSLASRLLQIGSDAMLSVGLAMGHELKLFDAIARVSSEHSPATSRTISESAEMRERYVREWLYLMVCGRIIESDESGEKFWIKPEYLDQLCSANADPSLVFQQHVVISIGAYKSVLQLFSPNGPLGMDNAMYDEFDRRMAEVSDKGQKHMISHLIPALGLAEKLANIGIHFLDIGCGAGGHILTLAANFPKSTFIGVDISMDAITNAKKRLVEADLTNASFIQMNAEKLLDEWTGKFDVVTMFNACHDYMRPDLSLKEANRVLKDDGLLTLFEIDGTGNVYKDKDSKFATFLHGISLLHCLPVASNSKGAFQLGAMCGTERIKALIGDAGFQQISTQPSPYPDDQVHILYLCHK